MTKEFKSQPANQNLAQPTRFAMTMARLPNVTWWCQTVILPGVSMGYAPSPTPFVDQKVPGDKLQYEPLITSILLDEDLVAWREVYSWMTAMTFPKDFKQYRDMKNLSEILKSNPRPQYSDIQILVYNSNWQPILRYSFIDAFPTSIPALNYSSADSPDTPMQFDVTFEYQWFDIVAASSIAG
jgi:hypothetical protein